MADVQKENGYMRFANEIADVLARVNLTAYQYRILWVIWRKTYGWNKKSDCIPRSQFRDMTGIDDRNIARTIKELERMNMVSVIRYSTKTAEYSFQKNYEAWRLVSNETQRKRKPLVSNKTTACISTDIKTCVSTDTLKRKKETTKENIAQKLSDKESLSRFLIEKTLPFSASINDIILQFVNRVRMSNKLKSIATARAAKIADALTAIAGKYGADNMAAGMTAAFKKADREGFNFSGHDPAAYVRAVAKSANLKTKQQKVEAAHRAERDALRAAPVSSLFDEIRQTIQ